MAATSSESVARSSQTSAARMMSLADSVASDGEVSSCRFSGRGSVSRFLAARRRESIDSGLTADSAVNPDFRRASDPLLNNCGVADTAPTQRCPSSASAPGTAALWRGHRVGGSVAGSHGGPASLMSSHSSIATNVSDDVDVKFTPPTSEPSVADQFVGGLIIPDEVRDFINNTYSSQAATATAAVSLNADSTVADSPAAPVESSSGFDEPAGKPTDTKPSCMYEGQAGGNSRQSLGNFTQPSRQLAGAVGDVHHTMAALPVSDVPSRSFDSSSTSYFRSPPSVPHAYQNGSGHEVQVSAIFVYGLSSFSFC